MCKLSHIFQQSKKKLQTLCAPLPAKKDSMKERNVVTDYVIINTCYIKSLNNNKTAWAGKRKNNVQYFHYSMARFVVEHNEGKKKWFKEYLTNWVLQ